MPTAADEARRNAVEAYSVVGAPPEADLEGLVQLAAHLCAVPTAVINIIDDRSQHQVAAVGFTPSVCAREDSMCAQVLAQPGRVVVRDARLDARFAGNPFVTGEIARVRFYASSPLVTPAGVAIGTICVFDDVERDLSDEAAGALDVLAHQVVDVLELRRSTRELARSNEQLAHFAAQVSHDLRNPLAALSGFIEIASASPAVAGSPVASAALTRAERSAQRMEVLIADLLDYANVGGGLRRDHVDLTAVAHDALADLQAEIASSGADVVVDAMPVMTGDATLLRVLFQNLVANAVKFSWRAVPDDVIPVVRVAARPVEGGTWITVGDNGPGVPPGDRERVFELLERGADTGVPGLGIGLSTCQRIVTAHGGRMGIGDSELGGALVWALLPDVGSG
jgi:signal transduction histidine kinase